MTNKVAFMNGNDNDYHLDLQVKIKKNKIFQFKYLNIEINFGNLYTKVYFFNYCP